jgi:hypothetical protein
MNLSKNHITEKIVGINEKTQSKTIIILHFMTKKQLSFIF